jgi:ribosomal protein S18 acetylase RimI-like enzyme
MVRAANIDYRVNTATANEISFHLNECDQSFLPSLSSRVEISVYADKLYKKATNFEAWTNGSLVGLVSVYFSKSEIPAFISNVSVSPLYLRLGIATSLIRQCKEFAWAQGLKAIKLEVNKNNFVAIAVYKELGFLEFSQNEDTLHLQCSI